MATQTIEFDAIPDAPVFDAIPDEPEFDAVPDEVITREAQRNTAAAIQAADLMTLPGQIAAAQPRELSRDEELFNQSESIAAQMKLAEDAGQFSGDLAKQYFALREQIDPNFLREAGAKEFAPDEVTPEAPPNGFRGANFMGRAASEFLQSIGSSALAARVEEIGSSPVGLNFQANIGPAAGGAAGSAMMMIPGGQALGSNLLRVSLARAAAPIIGGIGGSIGGGKFQETIHSLTETEEETAARQQALAQTRRESPIASMIGASAANTPFLGPSLSVIREAMAGNRTAMQTIAASSAIGGTMGALPTILYGEPISLGAIAQGALENVILNKPTWIGRKLGLPAVETMEPPSSLRPVSIERPMAESGLGQRGTTSTADVFAGVRKPETPTGEPNAQQISETGAIDGGVRAPEVTPEDVTLPTAESSEGVQPSRPGEPLAEATPEAAREVENVTSIRNAQVDAERAQRGLPPMDEAVPVENREMMQRAADIEANDPRAAARLVDTLVEKPRAIEPEEVFLLLRERTRLKSEYNEAGKRLIEAKETGDESAVAAAQSDVNAASDALVRVEQATGRGGAGTQQGRALQARKAFANEDFSLAQMETDLRVDQGGAPLSEKQKATVAEQADTIAKTQAEMDKILAEREFQRAAAEADKTVDPKVKSLADRIIARLDITAKNAATSLRSRLNNLGSAPDPLIVLDVAKIAAAKTAKGAIEFAQWSAEMLKEFGEKVRPFLQAGWDAREQHIEGEVNSVAGKQRKERSAADKEQSAIKARITSVANRTAEYQRRTAAGDFSPMRKPATDLSKNPEWVKLKAENDAAKASFEKARYEAKKAQRTTEQKVRDTVADVFAASRTLMASADISAVGRQGIFFALPDLMTNPVRLGRQMSRMLQSQFSESKFQRNEARIKSRENADLYEESGLYLADIDHKPSAREEQFKSEIAEKIPVLGKKIVRGSSRGFASMMNEIRADAMDSFVKWAGGRDKITPETAKYLAAAINDLSGRGNISNRKTQGALEWLATYLFSPRLWASRFNTAILKPIWRDPFNGGISPRARAVVIGQYAKFTGALLALKWLAGLNGGKMEEDPKDSDFGKLQFGSKRYDVMGGIGNMTTFLTRLVTGKTKDDKGKVQRLVWKDEKQPDRDLRTVIFQHLRNKMAPIPGALFDLRYGRHPDRSKVTPGSMVKQTVVPITVSDTIEYFQKDDPASAARDTLINALGISTQDYRKK